MLSQAPQASGVEGPVPRVRLINLGTARKVVAFASARMVLWGPPESACLSHFFAGIIVTAYVVMAYVVMA